MHRSKGDWRWLRDYGISWLADKMEVDRRLIDNWVRGRNDPDFISTVKLAKLVGSMEELERRAKVKIELIPLANIGSSPPFNTLDDRNYSYVVRVAELLKHSGRYDELHVLTSKALTEIAGKDKTLTARLWFDKSYAQLMLGHPLQAVESAYRARNLLPAKEDSILVADIHWFAGECLRVVSKLSEAHFHLEEAKKIYARLDAKPTLFDLGPIWLEWDMGRCFAADGKYDIALNHFEHMEKLAKGVTLTQAEVIAVWSRGDIADTESEFDDAFESYHSAKELARLIGDSFWEATALWRMAEVYRKLGQFDQAVATVETARGIFEKIGNLRMVAKVDCVLAACCLQRGLLDKSFDLYNSSFDIFSKAEDAPMERSVLIGLGLTDLAYESQKANPDYRKPLEAFLQIEANFSNIKDPYLNVYKDLAYAEALRLSGYTERALTHLHDVIKTCTSYGYQLEKAHALLGIAATKLMKGEVDRESCIEAFKLYRKVSSIWGQVQALITQALIERDMNGGGAHLLHEASKLERENSLFAKGRFIKSVQKEKHVLLFIQAV